MAADLGGDLSDDFRTAPLEPPIGQTHADPPTAPKPERAPHRGRFLVIYGGLAAVLGLAIAGLVIYAGRSINPAPAWSSWKPSGGGLGAAKQIASHVGGAYRLGGGTQLVDVIAKAPSVSPGSQVVPIHYVALAGRKGTINADFPVDSSNGLMYSLCGLGTSCSIASGKPSVERGTLVRREILELALYTFKYVGGVNQVMAFMPPTPGSAPQYVIYLQKQDLSTQLKKPLVDTLAIKPPLPSTISPSEQQTIDATTQSHIYKFSLSQTQLGDAVLVLKPAA